MPYIFIFFILLLPIDFAQAKQEPLPSHNITIEGQKHISTDALYHALGVETKSIFAFWKKDTPKINDKLLPTLKESLQNFYESEGFYDATFHIVKTNTTVDIHIKENQPIRVSDIHKVNDYPIASLIKLKKGDIFKAQKFIDTKNAIIEALLDEGYCSYDLDTKAYVDLVKHQANLKYRLKKGGICSFGKTNISGLKTIDEKVILSRVRAKEGERFNPKKVKETYADIYQLNSFDSVQINVNRKFYNEVPVDIALEEVKDAYHLEVGAGYDTYIGPRVHASIVKKNAWGNAKEAKLKLSWSQKEQLAIGEFYKPALFFLFDYGIDFGMKFGYSNLIYPGFREKKGFDRFFLEHNEGRLKLKVGMAVENIDISEEDNLKKGESILQAINAGTFLLLYPYIDMIYDARDDILNPKFGYYFATALEYGLDYKPNASSYLKAYIEGRAIYTFFDKLTLATVGKLGIVDEQRNELPESKLFFAGGSFSNRAYGFNTIGVIESKTSDSINGASTMLNLSVEADYPLHDKIYGALFSDNTMLNENSYDFSGDVISSAGLGVRYLTPIGPFKLDVGFNVNKPSEYGISFQIGQSF